MTRKTALALGVFLLLSQAALAQIGEIQNVRFEDALTLAWDSERFARGYHTYRAVLGDLPDYGPCHAGSLQGTSVTIDADPPPGTGWGFLISGFDENGEGPLGTDSASKPRAASIPCIPARRIFPVQPNGNQAGDGVNDGVEPSRNPSAWTWSSLREATGVYTHSGEFFLQTTDLSIPGRGLDFEFTRTYRSQVEYDGPLGHGWDFAFNARLTPLGSDVKVHDGAGRVEDVFGRIDTTHFSSPPGVYAVLLENVDDSFDLRWPDGTIQRFHALDGSQTQGALAWIEDRNGNRIRLLYDFQGLLTRVVDSMGRVVTFGYRTDGRLETVTDFTGRTWQYAYGGSGNDLISARSPLVTGTPNGNDFPNGKTTRYNYSSGFADARLNHNLLEVVPPNEATSGIASITNVYETDTALFNVDRVVSQTIGGMNGSGVAAGGTQTFDYDFDNTGADPQDPTVVRRMTDVVDRNGNRRHFEHNFNGNLLRLTESTNRNLRPGEPDYVTEHDYSADREIVETRLPAGNRIQYVYDSPGLDRFREGNVLERRRIADTLVSGGRGDGHGGELNDIVETWTYDPVYNGVLSYVEPRGNDASYVPQNGGTASAARYTKKWSYDHQEGDPAANGIDTLAMRWGIDLTGLAFNLGDLNNDGRTDQASGNAVRIDHPTVTLDASSNQAAIEGDTQQEIGACIEYNDQGQIVARIDPEGNRHEFQYYPENDPDGDGSTTPPPPDGRTLDGFTGGYGSVAIWDVHNAPGRDNGTDPTPAMIRHDFEYDPVGNRTDLIDGRGVRTRWTFNALNQVVELARGAATADVSGPGDDPATGRGETGLAAPGYRTQFAYDASDNLTGIAVEDVPDARSVDGWAETTRVYDLLDNEIEVREEATSLVVIARQLGYDANDNLIETTLPESNRYEWVYDERDLLLSATWGTSTTELLGGSALQRFHDYDGNGNRIKLTDGNGGIVDYEYDGLDRLTQTIDQVGNTAERFYDPASKLVRRLDRGPVGGPTPGDRLGTTNVDLADTEYRYDELNRLFRADRELFVPVGAIPARTPALSEGPSVPGDGFINNTYEYDRLSRRTFVIEDSGATWRTDWDGAGRRLKLTDPTGGTAESTWDPNDNLVELAETEVSSSTGPASELFLTTHFYDALDRREQSVDNAGQTRHWQYDSFDDVILASDANGPAGPMINRRSPAHGSMTVATNLHGNITRFAYDGLGRRLTTTRVLTVSGLGDGTVAPTPDTSNPANPDGEISIHDVWSDNSLLIQRQDDNGNVIGYEYDTLHRVARVTADDGTTTDYAYDPEGNLTQIVDANGSVIDHTYDAAWRRTATDVTPAAGVEGSTELRFEYDGLDRLTRGTDNNVVANGNDDVTTSFLYDSLGRTIEEGQTLSDGTAAQFTSFDWSAAGLPTATTYPSGNQVVHTHDGADRLVVIAMGAQSSSYDYFGRGRVHTRTHGNGVRSTRLNAKANLDEGFDEVRRTTMLRHFDSSDTVVAGFEAMYDRASNRTSIRRLHHPRPGQMTAGDFMGESYAFDSADRLIRFEELFLDPSHMRVDTPVDDIQYELDGMGNRTGLTRAGTDFAFTPNNNNEYDEMQTAGDRTDDGVTDDVMDRVSTPTPDGLNLTHDRNGNLTFNGKFAVFYDFRNLPVRAVRQSDLREVAAYAYDALGRRVRREVTNSSPLNRTRRYFYAGRRAIEEWDASDQLARRSVFGAQGEPLWQVVAGGTSRYFLEDIQGSVGALTESTGPVVVERMTYDPFGKPVFEDANNQPLLDVMSRPEAQSPQQNAFGFLGGRYDPELGSRSADVLDDMAGLYSGEWSPPMLIGNSALSPLGGNPSGLIGQSPLALIGSSPLRFYSPALGRFVSRNHDLLAGFGSFGIVGGRSPNPYAFSGQNPVSSILGTTYKVEWGESVAAVFEPNGPALAIPGAGTFFQEVSGLGVRVPGGGRTSAVFEPNGPAGRFGGTGHDLLGKAEIHWATLGIARPAGGAGGPEIGGLPQTHAGGSAWWDQTIGGPQIANPGYQTQAPNWGWKYIGYSVPPFNPPGPGPDPVGGD
jgi:YD repeat-containing protein